MQVLLWFIIIAGNGYYPGKLLVCFKPNIKPEISKKGEYITTKLPSFDKLAQKHKVYEMERWLSDAKEKDKDGDIYLTKIYRLKLKENIEEAVTKFSDDKNLIFAEFEPRAEFFNPQNDSPNDPRFPDQWHLFAVHAPEAWTLFEPDEPPSDTTIIIGITDSGVDWDHPDLIDNIWQNLGEDADGDGHTIEYIDESWVLDPDDLNGVDDDYNGYIDDLIGWDFGESDNNPEGPPRNPDTDPWDYCMHGTWTAGIADARTNNNLYIASVPWKVRIMPIKCCEDDDPQHVSDGYSGIRYAAENGADIINCSWGGEYGSSAGQSVINVAYNVYGAVICASAGNDGTSEPNYPAAYYNCMAIAGTSPGDYKWGGSQYGSWVDCCAPASGIWGTAYLEIGGEVSWDGTSGSAPIASGCFALLKSVYPDSSNIWLEQEILTGCDNIDDINPFYKGFLGAGRINIYNTFIHRLYPELIYQSYIAQELIGDGDSLINPGEIINIHVVIKNESGWGTANDAVGTLSSPDSQITIINSSSSFGKINGGSVAVNFKGFKVKILDFPPSIIHFNIVISANLGSQHPYSDTFAFEIESTLNQKHWPINLGAKVKSPPIIIDIDNDSELEVIAGDFNNNLWAWDPIATTKPGFPMVVGNEIWGAPAIGDVNADGDLEIVFGSKDKNLYIINNDDSLLLKYETQGYILSTPALADLNNDDTLEIIFGDYSGNLYVINYDSTNFGTFPRNLGTKIWSGAAIGDVDGNGTLDIVVGTYDKELYVISKDNSILPGWPQLIGGTIKSAPALADLDKDGKLEIVCGCDDGKLYIFDYKGDTVGIFTAGDKIRSSPSFCDIDGDSIPEIFFGSSDNNIYGIDANANLISGFPYITGGSIESSPVYADIDCDWEPEIIVGSNDGKLYALNTNGSLVTGFPINTNGSIESSPCIRDLDGDGDLEIAVGNSNGMQVIDYKDPWNSSVYWNMYRGNPYRTGNYEDVSITGGIDTQGPSFSETTLWPDTSFVGPFLINSTITDYSGVESATLWYRTNVDSPWISIPMDTIAGTDGYSAEIPEQPLDTKINYYLSAVDKASPPNTSTDPQNAPNSFYSFNLKVGIEEATDIPKTFALSQSYPNPFTQRTVIRYTCSCPCEVSLKIYDLTGRLVTTLVNERQQPGHYNVVWNGKNKRGEKVVCGLYFYRLEAGSFVQTKKMLLIR
ncbi:S8 family serine peptidase [candidate division WOR-3 bacterium]|nr:S8 family serine peptidase [candidate division WOR-3 bacterium]